MADVTILIMVQTIKATLEIDADGTLHLPLPPEFRQGKLRVTAVVEREESSTDAISPPLKGFGALKGQIWMADDFDTPLDDMKDYSE